MPKYTASNRSLGKSKAIPVPDYFIGGQSPRQFEGYVTALTDPKKLKPGAYIDGKNWITGQLKDHIELRSGQKLIGTGSSGAGKITGLGVGIRRDGTQVLFRSHGRKIEWAIVDKNGNVTTDWTETGSNLLPAAAANDDVSFAFNDGISGPMMYVSSTNSSIYKIPVANPSSAVDQGSTTYRGRIAVMGHRMWLWARKTLSTGFTDYSTPYVSYIDKATLASFTQTSAESVGTGDGVTKTFSGTLAARTGVKTSFSQTLTDGVETFIDDFNGSLVGSLGGTGTINYATGAYSVTFNTAPALSAAITTTYYTEDSTSHGLCDFSYSSPRQAGEGDYFQQSDGGNLQTVLSFDSLYYCIHSIKSWVIDLLNGTTSDTNATNLDWRDRLSIPYWRSAFSNGEGITLLDYTDSQNPRLRRLGYNNLNKIIPFELSEQLNLSSYEFNYAIVFEFSNYDLLFCQKKTLGIADTYNSILLIRNKVSGVWDKLEVGASCVVVYNGMLIAGDFTSNNCYQLFSGSDDDNYPIDNFITFGQLNLGVPGMKKSHRFEIDGYIGSSQTLEIWAAYDNATAVKIGTITGQDSCVDVNFGAVIGGTNSIGSDIVGSSGAPNAFHFAREFTISSDRYEQFQPTFKCTGVGPCAINYFGPKDNRYKGRRKLPQYDS